MEGTGAEKKSTEESYEQITKHATPKLFGHILNKGFQAGSLAGLLIAIPLAIRHYGFRKSSANYLPSALTVLERSAGAGVVLSGALGAAKVWVTPLDEEGIKERVYKLYYNQGQQRTDYFSLVGMIAGSVASALLVSPRGKHVLGGACMGAALGVMAHAATSQTPSKPNQMLEELKS